MFYSYLLIFMIIVFFSYVAGIIINYGVQPSISDSYYKLPKKFKWLFTIATWGYAIPAMIIGVPFSGLAFLAGAGIAFVGASPLFKLEDPNYITMERKVHLSSAIVGVVASQLLIFFVFGHWFNTLLFVLASVLTYFIPKMKPNITWWVEIYAFISIVISYVIKLSL